MSKEKNNHPSEMLIFNLPLTQAKKSTCDTMSKYSMPFCLISEISEVINIERRKAELNIILPRVNNFDIKQKKGLEYLFYYMPPTPNKIWQDKG